MKLKLDELNNAPDSTKKISFEECIKELDTSGPVSCELTLKKTHYGVNVSGKITAKLILECDRCLETYYYDINKEVNENYVNDKIVPDNVKEYELKEKDFVEELSGKEEIDITEFIYQSIILEIPYKKLCDDECLGTEEYQNQQDEEQFDERLEVFKNFSENNLGDN